MAGKSGSILQLNEELDVRPPFYIRVLINSQRWPTQQTTRTFDQFFEAQAQGQADAVRILDPLRLRYFTPTELLRLFHFEPKEGVFLWPEIISLKSQYKLIGNSVNVRVVTELVNYLFQE